MDLILLAAGQIATPLTLFCIVIGTVVGVVVGVLPGLGSVIGLTMVLPFTFSMPQIPSIALMLGVYCGSVYGGSITAIILNTPGTPQAAATALEGYPMARRGDADLALGWVTTASTLGGLFSVLVFILAGPWLARLSLQFTPIEYFALGVFAMTCIAGVSSGQMTKGLVSGGIGLMLASIGVDPVTGDMRYTFGSFQLSAGIALIPVIVGVFAYSEMFLRVLDLSGDKPAPEEMRVGFRMPPFKHWRMRLGMLLRGSMIGSFVGALPGTGAATAAFIAYSEARRTSKRQANFGKGEPDGLVACEASNNAVTGSALVPTLALGIPGDPVTAVMLGALVIQGVVPGPQLFANNLDLVYAIFLCLILVNLVMFATGALGAQLFTRILRIPEPILIGLILIISTVGAYGVNGSTFDIWVAFAAGVAGAVLRCLSYPLAPIVIGMVLGPTIEMSLRQGLILTDGNILEFLARPIATVLFLLTVAILTWPLIRDRLVRR
ncbi:tripartite tricarboxylate transporter permease [Marinovum sp.]|uniref:tripartite tricarboxylate transporter permease n=1 Tax=Marinovum sp. TaxID=2024839 RepID=UPI002B277469|nr:tripartite tricarboxylate transporter permease [Marinovum sp.]